MKTKGTTCVECLVKQQKWKKVTKALTVNNYGQHKGIYKCSGCKKYPKVVHYACRIQPPLSVITAMLVADPGSVFQHEFKNRYPLHIACEYGASTKVISNLIRKNKEAVKSQEINWNTPLHL